jgi:hypothetical protein
MPAQVSTIRSVRFTRVLLLASLTASVAVSAAGAHGGGIIRAALDGLRGGDPVYVDPKAIPTLETDEAIRVRERIAAAGGSVYVAVLPADAQHELQTADKVLEAVVDGIGLEGTYAVVVGGQFRATVVGGDPGRVRRLADEAVEEQAAAGIAPALHEFVDRVGAERSRGDSGISTGMVAALIGGLAALSLLATLVRARRRSSVG